jgi:glucosamine-6-phosphate deaminase
VALGGIDWSKVTLFHMDEYLGISADHPASFRYYMKERVESLVKPKAFHYIHGDCDLPHVECARYTALLESQAIDLCCLGVGENGHLAFNDPHVARLDTPSGSRRSDSMTPARCSRSKRDILLHWKRCRPTPSP